jgi:hypothetical protein
MQMPIDDPREIARCENQLENIAVKLKLSKDLEKRLLNF